jgi:transposase-like protein
MSGRKYSPKEKMEIVVNGLSSNGGIAEVCRRYGISTVQYYQWKDRIVKSAPEIFKRKDSRLNGREEELKAKLTHKDRVIAIITEENLELKKNLGE